MAKDREPLTILLVCQARPLRIGLRTMLAELGEQFTILEAASLENTAELPLDSAQLVIIYSGGSTTSLGEFNLDQLPPGLPVLWLTAAMQTEKIPLTSRPTGLLPIEAAEEEILASIQALRQGLSVFPPQILNSLKQESQSSASPLSIDPGKNSSLNSLTTRELEILQALGLGLTNKEIAAKVSLSENTVKFHLAAIFSKLEVNNRTEAVRHGMRAGLITL